MSYFACVTVGSLENRKEFLAEYSYTEERERRFVLVLFHFRYFSFECLSITAINSSET